jgi:hypothetical protein
VKDAGNLKIKSPGSRYLPVPGLIEIRNELLLNQLNDC